MKVLPRKGPNKEFFTLSPVATHKHLGSLGQKLLQFLPNLCTVYGHFCILGSLQSLYQILANTNKSQPIKNLFLFHILLCLIIVTPSIKFTYISGECYNTIHLYCLFLSMTEKRMFIFGSNKLQL